MMKIFDRFLKNPQDVSCGGEGGRGPASVEGSTAAAASAPLLLTPAEHRWIVGSVRTASGDAPLVASRLSGADRLGTFMARLGIRRMRYSVRPGLYGVGRPDSGSPVFVTANYKMSFDHLRRALAGRDGWILALDTLGINVWCAAGKGTFGTDELALRMERVGLAGVVSHRTLILPQLGAPGVAAHEITRRTNFHVVYGPIRAEDLGPFLDAGMTATPGMRLFRFGLKERLVLTPVEIVMTVTNKAFLAALAFWILGRAGLGLPSFNLPAVLGAVFIGAVVVPALLPWIPARPFALKGWLLGLAATVVFLGARGLPASAAGWLGASAYLLILPALSAFIAMGFTGSSPITSLSGVVAEMKTAVPLIALSGFLGAAALIASAVI